jgi:hypothetical protein
MRDPDGIEAPDELGEEPEAPYRPLLTAEEREELRREWLARLAPVDATVAGREGPPSVTPIRRAASCVVRPTGRVSRLPWPHREESFARRGDVRWLTPSGVADGTFEPIIGAPTGLNASS